MHNYRGIPFKESALETQIVIMEKIIQPIYRNMAKPFVLVFAKLKFHPNAVTLIGLGLSVIVGLLITQGLLRIAIVFYILMVIMDHADGQLARKLT